MAPSRGVRPLLAPAGFLWLIGCVTSGSDAVHPAPDAPYRHVQLVGKVPPPARYRYVGRVSGVAPQVGFVDAVNDARVDIKTKAAKMGAAVVKIDRVKLPPSARQPSRSNVLLVGRAYRAVEVPPRVGAHRAHPSS